MNEEMKLNDYLKAKKFELLSFKNWYIRQHKAEKRSNTAFPDFTLVKDFLQWEEAFINYNSQR